MEINNIIEGCKRGDTLCQSKLYDYCCEKVRGTVMRYIKNYADAEDIVQDGFIKLYANIHKYSNTGSFEGWVARMFRNTAIDHLRSKKEFYELNTSVTLDLVEEYDMGDEERIVDIKNAMSKLSRRHKEAITMYFFEEMSHKEIAENLKISEGTSKSNLHRAKNKIIGQLKDKIYEQN